MDETISLGYTDTRFCGHVMLTYHNSFGIFCGETADAVLHAVHAEASRDEPSSYEEWWKYNQWVWREHHDWNLPDIEAPNASQIFLERLVEIGALFAGLPEQDGKQTVKS